MHPKYSNLTFIKVKSRLGLFEIPWGVTEKNEGVELGPDYLLDNEFLNRLNRNRVLDFSYSDPDSLTREKYLQTLQEEYLQYDQVINSKLNPNDINILVGGDHSVSYGSYLWLTKNFNPAKTLVIHIDTHPDIMLVSESDTLNFHGKWQRPFFDKFDRPEFEKTIPQKLLASRLIMVGNFNDEKANYDFVEKANISNFRRQELDSGIMAIKDLVKDSDHIHISFDVDSLDHSIMPATGIPCQDGLFMDDIYKILDSLTFEHTFSLDLVEYNPLKDKDLKSRDRLQEFLTTLLQKYLKFTN